MVRVNPGTQVINLGKTYSSRVNDPGCPECGATKAWSDANGTTHYACRAVVSEGLMVAKCVPGLFHTGTPANSEGTR